MSLQVPLLARSLQVAAISIAATLTVAQSGCVIYLSSAGAANFALTLPLPELGLNYKLVQQTAGARTITVTPNTGTFYGYLIGSATVVVCANKATVVMNSGTNGLAGDILDLRSDGTNWHVCGFSGTAAAFA